MSKEHYTFPDRPKGEERPTLSGDTLALVHGLSTVTQELAARLQAAEEELGSEFEKWGRLYEKLEERVDELYEEHEGLASAYRELEERVARLEDAIAKDCYHVDDAFDLVERVAKLEAWRERASAMLADLDQDDIEPDYEHARGCED